MLHLPKLFTIKIEMLDFNVFCKKNGTPLRCRFGMNKHESLNEEDMKREKINNVLFIKQKSPMYQILRDSYLQLKYTINTLV